MRLYAIVSAVSAGYPIAVLWCYVAAFVLAMALMFVFPPGTIVLLWVGLMSLAAVVIVHHLLALMRNVVARFLLSRGSCPSCGHGMGIARDVSVPWTCEGCGTVFLPSGAEAPALS
jgi:hypothetical protein